MCNILYDFFCCFLMLVYVHTLRVLTCSSSCLIFSWALRNSSCSFSGGSGWKRSYHAFEFHSSRKNMKKNKHNNDQYNFVIKQYPASGPGQPPPLPSFSLDWSGHLPCQNPQHTPPMSIHEYTVYIKCFYVFLLAHKACLRLDVDEPGSDMALIAGFGTSHVSVFFL